MSETPEREPEDRGFTPTLSGKQKAGLFGVMLVVFISARLALQFVFPDDCRVGGALIFMLVGLPTYFSGLFLLSAWSGGGERAALFWEGGLSFTVVLANLFALNLVKCFFESAWYWTFVYMPVFVAAIYFWISRLTKIAAKCPPTNEFSEEGSEA